MSVRRDNFKLAVASLKSSKPRSFLTMLGIIIGVAAVVSVICIGQGVKQQISRQVASYGNRVITVKPANTGQTSVLSGSGLPTGSSALLSSSDLQTVQITPGVHEAVPLSTATGSMRGDHTVSSPFIVATTADFSGIIKQSFAYGGFFDSDQGSKTIVLGQAVAHQLFDDNAPLGQTLTYRGQNFVVAGVFSQFNAPPFSLEANFNNAVFIPYSTAQSLSGGQLGIYQILAQTNTAKDVPTVATSIQHELTTAHGGSDDVSITKPGDGTSSSDQTVHLLTILVTGVAVIALLVGGVGIMNMMLVSVTERIHEIGLRKAIGATNRQILRQFIAEAFVLSVTGAVIGVAIAAIAVGLLRLYSTLQPLLVWQAFVFVPLTAIGVGVFFGAAPALKAAHKDPIEALRHE